MNANDHKLVDLANKDCCNNTLSADDLRKICLEEGADDAGFVDIGRPALEPERDAMLRIFPGAATAVSLLVRANRESVTSPSTSVADWEFAKTIERLADAAFRIIRRLNSKGIRGIAVPPAFPMDTTRWPGKLWEVSHKIVASEAGLGMMGVHRVIIHPKFGNHVILDTILINVPLDRYDQPLPESPCFRCGLCISVCPVGAIRMDEGLDFMSCAMHNYHELFGGFQEWIEKIVSSGSVRSYRAQFRDYETIAKWESLTYGHSYRCSYCMAVCPAGEETVEAYRRDKKAYVQAIVRPLREKREPVYVIKGTRAEKTARSNTAKTVRYVKNTIRPASIGSFLDGVTLLFNPEKAEGVKLNLQFTFTGGTEREATINIANRKIIVSEGHQGIADLRIRADAEAWVRMLNEEISPVRVMITGSIKFKGNPKHLKTFKSCLV
ncbi:MAG TPA: alkyl sulfatase C-terminal domain-containing protein [Nitrospirota bacterium]|nr:alkyl sulfatase C-terminal domain-containing protein [Nitrospirota bacterium]